VVTRIAHLTEAGVLARILPQLPQDGRVEVGPGDDAAVVHLDSPRLVITTDTLTEGEDFLMEATRPEWIGARAAVQNLADVAAMGVRPQGLVVATSAPPTATVEAMEAIAAGLAGRCARFGASVVGGDLGAADRLSLTVTAFGALAEDACPVLRSTARPGDVLAVGSEQLGRSGAGLAWVLAGRADEPSVAELVAWHDAPDPALELGWTRAPGRATAMLDLSDGLVRDAGRIAEASGVVVDLDGELLAPDVQALQPVARALAEVRGGGPRAAGPGARRTDPDPTTSGWQTAQQWVLHGGEEHAMLATFPPSQVPEGFRRIGRVRPCGAGEQARILLDGGPVPGTGFDHFA
jgi:thiamine-monophosphate kinase